MSTRSDTIADRLADGMLLADGAMGTELSSRGASFGRSFDELNLSAADLVADIHRDYVLAGADIVLTNTFCSTPTHLDRWGISSQFADINRAGVALARRGATPDTLIAGSVGPSNAAADDRSAAFTAQIEVLLDAGADLLWFETFSDLDELDTAIDAARALSALPIIASVTFSRDGYTLRGATPEQVARHLSGRPITGLGVNCSTGPLAVSNVAQRYRQAMAGASGPFLAALPNAGFPEPRGGRIYYPATPDYLATSVHRLRSIGCRIVGGCCGTTPAHIAAMRQAIDEPIDVAMPIVTSRPAMRFDDPPTASPGRSSLSAALAAKQFVMTVEMEPPRGTDTTELEQNACLLRDAGATVLDISDIPMARLRMTGLAAASRVQTATGLETVLHFPVRGRNLLRVQGDLLAAHSLGVRNLFITMGDLAAIGDYPNAFDNHDIVPTALVRLVKERFNAGVDSAGSSIGAPCEFVVGAATTLTPFDIAHEVALLHRKVLAGADFLLTQPVFDAAAARAFLRAYENEHGPLTVPLLAGILPLASARHANFLNNEVPGMQLGPGVLRAMESAGADGRTVGLAIAHDIAEELRASVAGLYLIPAFRRYSLLADFIASF
jgi:methionine synthase / methylenetetrahydrofolate reductase(NADPH)